MAKREQTDTINILLAKTNSKQLLKVLLKKLQEEEQLEIPQLIQVFQEVKQEKTIPLSIFAKKLHPAEALCKYLKENEKLSNQEIAKLLGRDQRSVWATYKRAKESNLPPFSKKKELYQIPFSVFQDTRFSFLESAVFYLTEVHRLRTREIAKLLETSRNSVAVLLKRAKLKNEK